MRSRHITQRVVGHVIAGHDIVHETAVAYHHATSAANGGRGHITARGSCQTHRVVNHISPLCANHAEGGHKLVRTTVVAALNHVVGYNDVVVLRAMQVACADGTGTMRCIYLIRHNAHCSAALENLQDIALVGHHIVHLVALDDNIGLVLNVQGCIVLIAEYISYHGIAFTMDRHSLALNA